MKLTDVITATRYHDFSAGHKVSGHENKCRHLHGHNYRVHFTIASADMLDGIGRVMDFSVIKDLLCEWLEQTWDHKFLIWSMDDDVDLLADHFPDDVVVVPFNPTAENMAKYLVEEVAPEQLQGTGCALIECRIDETRKCSATYKL